MLEFLFIYPKVRAYYLHMTHNREPMSRAMFDIMMYIRYFGSSDGWVMNRPVREYMNYEIWQKRGASWKWTINQMLDRDFIQMRTRQSVGKKFRKGLGVDEMSGQLIEYKLTAKGTMLMIEFDDIAKAYIDKHIHKKRSKALGEKEDIFNL